MTSVPVPLSLPRGVVAQLVRGFSYPFAAFGFMRRHRLLGVGAAAILVNVVLLAILVLVTAYWIWPYVSALEATMLAWAQDSTFLRLLVGLLSALVWFLALVLLVGLSGLLLLLVGQAVASPFLDVLSERVERLVRGEQPEPVTARRTVLAIRVALGDLVFGLVYLALVNLPIWLLGFFVAPLAGVLSFVSSALLLAHEFIGLPLARGLVSYRERWRFVLRHKALALGFGTAAMALFFVPGLNLILLPLATVGGTLLYCDLRASGRLDA